MVCLKGEIVITIRPYDTLYLLRSETHLNKDCTVLHLSDTIIPPVGSLTLISETNAQIPFVFYTTNSTNNRINLTESVGGGTQPQGKSHWTRVITTLGVNWRPRCWQS